MRCQIYPSNLHWLQPKFSLQNGSPALSISILNAGRNLASSLSHLAMRPASQFPTQRKSVSECQEIGHAPKRWLHEEGGNTPQTDEAKRVKEIPITQDTFTIRATSGKEAKGAFGNEYATMTSGPILGCKDVDDSQIFTSLFTRRRTSMSFAPDLMTKPAALTESLPFKRKVAAAIRGEKQAGFQLEPSVATIAQQHRPW